MLKKVIKRMLMQFGLDIRRIPEYEKNLLGWLRSYDIVSVLDIGANVGQFALEINKFLPNAHFYSFEPLINEYQQLIKNTKKILYFRGFNIALGEANEHNLIHSHKFSPASSLLKLSNISIESYPFIGNSIEEEVVVMRLDDFVIREHILLEPEILIKMDVQGFEDRVIRGGRETFKKAKVVITEVCFQELYTGQILFDGIYDQLKGLGFEGF